MARERRSVPSDRDRLLDWVERLAMFCAEQYGMPPITGRVLGWLMVCDPPEQSGGEIAAAIGASRASITTNIRLLTGAGLVRRVARRGERTAYYVLEDDAWEAVVMRRMRSMAAIREIFEEGIDLLGGETDRAARMRGAREVYAWVGDAISSALPMPRLDRSKQ